MVETFEEAIQKATRMLESGASGVTNENFSGLNKKELWERMDNANTSRLFAITEAIARGENIEAIYKSTGVDKWFLFRLKIIVEIEKELKKSKNLDKNL